VAAALALHGADGARALPPTLLEPTGGGSDDESPPLLAAPAGLGAARALRRAAVAALTTGVLLAGWQVGVALWRAPSDRMPANTGTTDPPATASSEPPRMVPVAVVRDFDPEGNGEENGAQAVWAVDGDEDTAWRTKTYFNRPNLGGTKDGVGLLLDLGSRQEVSALELGLVGAGTHVELRASDRLGTEAGDFRLLRRAQGAGTAVTLRPDSTLTTRYLLIWLTRLPPAPDSPGDFRGGITEVVVRG
jgi:putative peptidoglycan lipid II flippase